MKAILIVLSVAANIALATLLVVEKPGGKSILDFKWASATPAGKTEPPPAPITESEALAMGLSMSEAKKLRSTWSKLQPNDVKGLVGRLEAEGFPPEFGRAVIVAIVNDRYAAQRRALYAPILALPYWKDPYALYSDPDRMMAQRAISREISNELKNLLGTAADDANEYNVLAQRRRWGDIPRDKARLAQEILNDYNEMSSNISQIAMGAYFPEDREKLAFLEKQKRIDLAAVLSPEELEQYDLRNSTTASRLRSQLAGFQPSEEEFKAIFRIQRALEEQAGIPIATSSYMGSTDYIAESERRRNMQKKLIEQVPTVLTAERAADYKQANDPRYSQLYRLAARLELPRETVQEVVALQDATTLRAAQIRGEKITPEQKTANMQALSEEVSNKLTTVLGERGAEAYKATAGNWLRNLSRPTMTRPPVSAPAAGP